MDYLHDPKAIYHESFKKIREEADLSFLPKDIADVTVRLIHACGMIDIVNDLYYSKDAIKVGYDALLKGAPVLCDSRMVVEGIIRSELDLDNKVLCWNNYPECKKLAKKMKTTLSAAAVEFWKPQLSGAIVTIGNAPTTLFRLLEILKEGADPPAVIFGFPVGFVGAAESKELLIKQCKQDLVPFLTLSGRRGGSAMAAAVILSLIHI